MSDFGQNAKIYIASNNGMVGSALLKNGGYDNLIIRNSKDFDLRESHQVDEFFKLKKPEFVFLAAANKSIAHPALSLSTIVDFIAVFILE